MALMVIPNAGKSRWLNRMLDLVDADAGGLSVALYTNDYTPVDASVLDDFDIATFDGSDPFPVDWGDWPAAVLAANIATSTLAVAPNWTCTGGTPETCYGWLAWGGDSGDVYMAQRFENPRYMAAGAEEKLDPFKISLKTFV